MLLLSPAFAYPALQKIPLDCTFEEFLGNRYHDPVSGVVVPCEKEVLQARHVAMPSPGKESGYTGLAA